MPELPEVETMRLSLNTFIKESVSSLIISDKKLRKNLLKEDIEYFVNFTLLEVIRKGKFLFFHFISDSQNNTLVMHAGMSGNFFIFNKKDYTVKKHDHIIFQFNNNKILVYNDPRRFGLALLFKNQTPYQTNIYQNLGIDALDINLSAETFYSLLSNKNQTIKASLLNQKLISGIGNIYALEGLFLSNISPLRISKNISKNESNKLYQNIQIVLNNSINLGGSTLKDYKKADGSIGNFQKSFNVYGREGEPCFVCKNAIIKTIQNQRSSFYCNFCQT